MAASCWDTSGPSGTLNGTLTVPVMGPAGWTKTLTSTAAVTVTSAEQVTPSQFAVTSQPVPGETAPSRPPGGRGRACDGTLARIVGREGGTGRDVRRVPGTVRADDLELEHGAFRDGAGGVRIRGARLGGLAGIHAARADLEDSGNSLAPEAGR